MIGWLLVNPAGILLLTIVAVALSAAALWAVFWLALSALAVAAAAGLRHLRRRDGVG